METKTQVVVFINGRARVLTNPDPSAYIGKPHVINPSFDRVHDLPPHCWALEDGKLVPAQREVQLENELHHLNEAKDTHTRVIKARQRKEKIYLTGGHFLVLLLSVAISTAISFYLRLHK